MKIAGVLKQNIEIETTPIEMIKSLFLYYFNTENYNSIIEKDNKLYFENDISIHGSPLYEYKEITADPKKIEIYRALKCLLINI